MIWSLNLYYRGLYILLNGNLTISCLEKVLKMATIECKTYSSNADIPKRAYQGLAMIVMLQKLKS